jgi:hypothetical protein
LKKPYLSIVFDLAAIIILAAFAHSAWLGEIVYRLGWGGLEWLSRSHFSIFFIILFVVAAYLLPLRNESGKKRAELLLPGIFLYTISLIAFHLAKILLFTIYSRMFPVYGYKLVVALLLIAPTAAAGFHYVTDRYIMPVRNIQFFLLILAMLAAVPLSRWSVQAFAGLNLSDGKSFVDAVKMGYPFFWIVFTMGLASILTGRFYRREVQPPEPPSRDDILDDRIFQ